MIVHLYTFIYNEERILPFFFKHYEKFVNKFFIYDNNSTDGTKKFVKKRKDVVYLQFDTDNKFDEYELVYLRNNEWKKSANDADWIIVCDADEFLFFKDKKKLLKLINDGYSVIRPIGYDMKTKKFPSYNKSITKSVRKGLRIMSLDKPVIFRPDMVNQTNFSFGSHFALPEGRIKLYNEEDIKLLHYKNLGVDYALEKKNLLKERVPEKYIKNGISKHYRIDDEVFRENFKKSLKNTEKII